MNPGVVQRVHSLIPCWTQVRQLFGQVRCDECNEGCGNAVEEITIETNLNRFRRLEMSPALSRKEERLAEEVAVGQNQWDFAICAPPILGYLSGDMSASLTRRCGGMCFACRNHDGNHD